LRYKTLHNLTNSAICKEKRSFLLLPFLLVLIPYSCVIYAGSG